MKKTAFTLLCAALLAACGHDNRQSTSGATPEATPVNALYTVKPPMDGKVNVGPQVFMVPPDQATELTLPNGGVIRVPEHAFVYADGRPVTEKVELRYREFRTPGEIIASGIPMKAADAEGHEGWLQTAGMFEMTGFVNGQPVQIAPHKEIEVEMMSLAAGKYDEWFFDPQTGNWVDIGDSEARPKPGGEMANNASDSIGAEENAVMTPPAKPRLLNKNKPKLDFDVNYDRFPELKAMKGMVLQYNGQEDKKDPANNQWIFTHHWEDIKLVPLGADGGYQLTLESDENTYSIPVAPCLSGEQYTVALRTYETQLADYKKSLEQRSQRQQLASESNEYLRSMGLDKFGIFNYDIFMKNPENVRVMASFEYKGEILPDDLKNAVMVYLIGKDGSLVVGFDRSSFDKFSFNPQDYSTQLLAILPGQKVAHIDAKAFRKLVPELKRNAGGAHTFLMDVKPYVIESVADIDKALAYRS